MNAWYLTAYKPILNDNGRVSGILYVGVKQESVNSLRQSIMNTEVGKSGYVFVLGGLGDEKGSYIISKNGERDGENILDEKDADGRMFIRSIVDKAIVLENGQIDFEKYTWKNIDESKSRNKLAAIAYFEPWDWVIGVGAYEDDLNDTLLAVNHALSDLLMWIVGGGIILLLLGALISYLSAKNITGPIIKLTNISGRIAMGELYHQIDIVQNDEVGILADSYRTMVENLNAGNQRIQADIEHSQKTLLRVKEAAESIKEGNLQVNASAEGCEGVYRDLIISFNDAINNILQPMQEAIKVIDYLAEKNLTQRMTGDYKGDHARIKMSLNKTLDILDQGFAQVAEASLQVAAASNMIAIGSQGVAQGATEQASSIQDLTGNLEAMADKAKQSLAFARESNEIAHNCNINISSGLNNMKSLSHSIARIKESSDATSKIVKTIDEIGVSDQPAGVECGRRGCPRR